MNLLFQRSCPFLVLAMVLLFSVLSCRKETTTNIVAQPADTAVVRDTIAQNVYSVVRDSSVSRAGVITVSPYISGNFNSGMLLLMDGAGHALAQKVIGTNTMDFRRWNINGTVRYTWFVYDHSYYTIPVIGQPSGYTVIADSNLNELKRVTFVNDAGFTQNNNQGTDAHDFILIDDNHYISMTYYQKTVSNCPDSLATNGSPWVVAPIIQEVQNNQVIWQWDGTSYPEFYTSSIEWNNFADTTRTQDYLHMNSMCLDPRDNNLILSFRNLNQIVKINRSSGAVMWRLGGKNSDFALSSDQQFLRQHFVRLTDNNQTLIVFDNGEATLRPYSRILEFQLDEKAKSVRSFKYYDIPEPFTQFTGSVQKIGSHYFIGGGTANYVLEVDPATGKKYLEMTGNMSSYRAYKFVN